MNSIDANFIKNGTIDDSVVVNVPDTDVDELISRQEVEDLIMETDPFWYEGMTRAIFEGIKRLRPIKPKRGKWLNDGKPYALYQCSECKVFCTVAGYANCIPEKQMYKTFKFCNNCGAPMGEVSE